MKFLIPYVYETQDNRPFRLKSGYFISYEPDTNEYLVLASSSETDFEYIMLEVCQSLSAAVEYLKKRLAKG